MCIPEETDIASKTSMRFKKLYNILLNKYYVDEIYESTVVKPIQKVSESFLWKFTDTKIIDGAVNGTAKLIEIIRESNSLYADRCDTVLCTCNDAWNCNRFILDNFKFISYGKQLSSYYLVTHSNCGDCLLIF